MTANGTQIPPVVNGVPSPPLALDGFVVPHALSFQAIYNTFAKTYSYRWDEAVRDNRVNALAMRRGVFIMSLLQERYLAVSNLDWELEVDEPNDPAQKFVLNGMTACIKQTFKIRKLFRTLLEAVWYGRYGAQLQWQKSIINTRDWIVTQHAPVNGDKIQYQWDGTPLIMLAGQEASRIRSYDPDSIVVADAQGPMLKLQAAAYRGRFVIHSHDSYDSDYWEGDMAGSRWGIGLRSYFYWDWWLRQQMLEWAISFMQSIGTTQLAVVNYEMGNAAAKAEAERIASQLSGKVAILMPRSPGEKYQAVEIISVDMKGVETLQGIIENYFEKRMERMAVGQSMSAGADHESGLGGTGRANFAQDTKFEITKWDAQNLAETLTTDLVGVSKLLNYPNAKFPVRFKFSIPDPRAQEKMEQAERLVKLGLPLDGGSLRRTTGWAKPEPGDEVIGGDGGYSQVLSSGNPDKVNPPDPQDAAEVRDAA